MNTKTKNKINTSDHRSHAQKAAGLPLKRVSNTLCSNAPDKSAPLGRCPKCKQPLRYYDGCLGYEAARCDACNFERDLHAEENGNPIEGEFTPADKSAHTPGPWKVAGDVGLQLEIEGGDKLTLAFINTSYSLPDATAQANARLIAAAPDLLEACKAMADYAEKRWPAFKHGNMSNQLRAAIQKAEGSAQ